MEYLSGKSLAGCIKSACENLDKNKESVNELNVFPVPDGDTGTNMTMTIKSAVNKVESVKNQNVSDIAKALSQGSLMGARGNSGVILSQLCRGISKALKDKDKITVKEIREGFIKSKETAYKAVMKPTEGTILTVCRKMAEASEEFYDESMPIDKYLYKIYLSGKKALSNTPNQLPILKEAGVVDAGGQGLIFLLEGAIKYLNEDIEEYFEELEEDSFTKFEEDELSYIANVTYKSDIDLREELSEYANINNYDDSDNISVELSTNRADIVMQIILKNAEIIEFNLNNKNQKEEVEEKEFGIVVVSKGDGFDKVFKDLGVDEIISGGQTMNPSTEDIYNAINNINAKNIFILPNNKNIIMSAKQVKHLTDKNIFVIETKFIPEGFSALLSFDNTASAKENFESMNEAIDAVKICEITYSIRDTKIKDLIIKKGDVIGLIDGDISASGKDINQVLKDTLKKSIDEDTSLITLYYGDEVDDKDANDLVDELQKQYDDIDFELVYGGQPLYYYSVSLE